MFQLTLNKIQMKEYEFSWKWTSWMPISNLVRITIGWVEYEVTFYIWKLDCRCMIAGWHTKNFPVVSSRRLLLRNLLILRQLVKLWSSSLITYINLFSHPCHTLGRHKFQQFMPVNIWLTKISANTWYQYFLIQVILLLLFFFFTVYFFEKSQKFFKVKLQRKEEKTLIRFSLIFKSLIVSPVPANKS